MERISYRKAVGCLMYLMIVSRRDIAFAVGQISRYCKNPGPAYWEMVIRILTYLSRTRNHWLFFSGSSQLLNVYSDANFTSDLDRHPSTTGYVFFHNGGRGGGSCLMKYTPIVHQTVENQSKICRCQRAIKRSCVASVSTTECRIGKGRCNSHSLW